MKKKIQISISILLSYGILSSCSSTTPCLTGTWETYVFPTYEITNYYGSPVTPFDTVMQLDYLVCDGQNKEKVQKNYETLYHDEVDRLHRLYDIHNPYRSQEGQDTLLNNLYFLNQQYGTEKAVTYDKDLFDLLKVSLTCMKDTDGYFNLFAGQLSDYWNTCFQEIYNDETLEKYDPFFSEERRIRLEELVAATPTLEEIDEIFTFNERNHTIIFHELPNVTYQGRVLDRSKSGEYRPRITVGAIAKGYATHLIKQKFKKKHYDAAYFYSGGSSMTTSDTPIYDEGEQGQFMQFLDPRTANQIIGKKAAFSFYLTKEFSVSTSGDYTSGKNYSFRDSESGQSFHRYHIINPKTGYSYEGHSSITVVSYSIDAGTLDALSTAFMCLPLQEALSYREKILQKLGDGYDLEIVFTDWNRSTNDLVVTSTSNFQETFQVEEGVTLQYV